MRTALLLAIALSAAGSLIGFRPVDAAATTPLVGVARDARPDSRIDAGQAIDDAVAAALVGAIANQFDDKDVQVRLDSLETEQASFAQRDLRGRGRLKIGEAAEWIPFSYAALYDTEQASVGYPRLVLGDAARGRVVDREAGLHAALAREAGDRLRGEFGGQDVDFSLGAVRAIPVDSGRYLHLVGQGVADFGREGTASTGVDALYDPHAHRWVRVAYELGAASTRELDDAAMPVAGGRLAAR